MKETFLTYETDFFSIFGDAGKFCLANGLGQLQPDDKSDVRTLNFRCGVTYASPRKKPNGVRKSSKIKKVRTINKF